MVCVVLSIVLGELPLNNTSTAVTTPVPTERPHSCSDGEFVCGAHGECVPMSKVCDFRHDCSDGSDEINCGKMSFSSPVFMCSYPPLSLWLFFLSVSVVSLFCFLIFHFSHMLLCCFCFFSVAPSLTYYLTFSSEGTVRFWRWGHLRLEES